MTAGGASPEEVLAHTFREESGRIRAGLIFVLRDFERADDALMEASSRALVAWRKSGVPDNPGAWLMATAKNRAIDVVRRDKMLRDKEPKVRELEGLWREPRSPIEERERAAVVDDRLRLIFTCCHPALATEAQVALTLQTLCGLATDEIARAFLLKPQTMAQRLVRAKKKIKVAAIPYEVPDRQRLPERTASVLFVLYLIFNEGYTATSGAELVRSELCNEAIRLARLLDGLLPDPEVRGLLALLLLIDSRRAARTDEAGDLIMLEDQDRSLWDAAQIEEGARLLKDALAMRAAGPYQLQAAINAVHANAAQASETDWPQIAALYGLLAAMQPTAVVTLNRAVAVAMADGPEDGLALLDGLAESLADYHLLHAARADLLRRAGRRDAARDAYGRALALAQNETERRHLARRLRELADA